MGLAKRDDGKMCLVCECECGKNCTFLSCAVTSGRSASCGCLGIERIRKSHLKHGHSCRTQGRSREYLSWSGMIARCYNPNVRGWLNWGGRGITVCEHWKESFEQFLQDMGPKPEGLTLDRRDNDKGYLCPLCCPPIGNCHWTTWSDQLGNRRKMSISSERKSEVGKRVWASWSPERQQAHIARWHSWWTARTLEEKREHGIMSAASRWGKEAQYANGEVQVEGSVS
jgi:hypothetical protein